MNNSSVNIIKRQLLIIQFLLESNFVSTEDIQNHLKTQGIETQLRTIQRDLAILEDIIPLESKKDDKPYSWRWKRLPDTFNHGLSISQAIVLRMVEVELKGVIPDELYANLKPLFVKAHYTQGLSQLPGQEVVEKNQDFGKTLDLIGMPLTTKLLLKLRILQQKSKSKNTFSLNQSILSESEEQKSLINLAKELQKQELDFLVELLKLK